MQTNNRLLRRIPALALMCLLTPPALAAESAVDPWMTDRYEVEVIVFRHADQSRNTPELPADASIIGSSPLDLYPERDAVSPGPYADPFGPDAQIDDRDRGPVVGFYLLDLTPRFPDYVPLDGSGQLGNIYARLERLDAYEPMLYRAWVQAARPAAESVPVEVNSEVLGEFGVAGSITLYKERYVHLQVDLGLAPTPPEAQTAAPEAESWPVFSDVVVAPDPAPVPLQAATAPEHKLQESRRIRGVNAQYFDHPQFGVIALVTEIDLAEDQAE